MRRLHSLLSYWKVIDSLCRSVVFVANIRCNNGDKELDVWEPEQVQIQFQKGKTVLVVVLYCTNLGVIIVMFFCLHVHTLTIFSHIVGFPPDPLPSLFFHSRSVSALRLSGFASSPPGVGRGFQGRAEGLKGGVQVTQIERVIVGMFGILPQHQLARSTHTQPPTPPPLPSPFSSSLARAWNLLSHASVPPYASLTITHTLNSGKPSSEVLPMAFPLWA